jgi:hypothetical protein
MQKEYAADTRHRRNMVIFSPSALMAGSGYSAAVSRVPWWMERWIGQQIER